MASELSHWAGGRGTSQGQHEHHFSTLHGSFCKSRNQTGWGDWSHHRFTYHKIRHRNQNTSQACRTFHGSFVLMFDLRESRPQMLQAKPLPCTFSPEGGSCGSGVPHEQARGIKWFPLPF